MKGLDLLPLKMRYDNYSGQRIGPKLFLGRTRAVCKMKARMGS
jgi:hypothetical protein